MVYPAQIGYLAAGATTMGAGAIALIAINTAPLGASVAVRISALGICPGNVISEVTGDSNYRKY
jgi:hypothetical protein